MTPFRALSVPIAFLLAVAWAGAQERPNVVFILCDDLGVDDLNCYGRKDQPTPNLDRLAAGGARFTTAYCGLSICSASRAAIMTGKAPARVHITTFLPGRPDAPSQKLLHPEITMNLPSSEVTLAERFKAAGYAAGIFGKWHLGNARGSNPKEQGFDEAFLPGGDSQPSATEGGKNEYAITNRAIDFIERRKGEPFFAYVAHHTPHIRLAAKPELVAKHADAFNPVYAAMMETLDDTVGLILATLKKNDLTKNTIVIFTSDNGGLHVLEGGVVSTHNSPFRAGKGYLYEGGLRIPLIVSWPGRIPAAVVAEPTVNMDLTPTLMELCGLPAPTEPDLDGASIASRLKGGPAGPPRTFAFHFPHYTNQGSKPAGAIREGDWKLIEYYDDGHLELYDLAADPSERADLAAKHPDRAKAMQSKLAAWRTSIAAQSNTPNPSFNPALGKPLYVDFDASAVRPLATAVETAKIFEAWRKLMNQAVAGAQAEMKAKKKAG